FTIFCFIHPSATTEIYTLSLHDALPIFSRMTISLTSDDQTFEQIKKQLNRSVEVIKVIDFTDIAIHMKELMFIKVNNCSEEDLRSEEHTSELQSRFDLVCRLLLEKKKK